jgi:hypothetical protein
VLIQLTSRLLYSLHEQHVVDKSGSRIILTMLKVLNCVNCEPIN